MQLACESAEDYISAGHAFDGIAKEYDEIFTRSLIGKAQRSLVHEVLKTFFYRGDRILELNCGTGEDAAFLTSHGVSVLACDASEGMIEVASRRLSTRSARVSVSFAVCANERLDTLQGSHVFDGVLSNFGGLNCTRDLSEVAGELARLVRPGGRLFLCLMGRVCAWEQLWYCLRGEWRKAFRRIATGGTKVSLGGTTIDVHYPSAREMRAAFAPYFRLESRRGIGVALPPSWMEASFHNRPKLVDRLTAIDRRLGALPVFRGMADHVLFQFVREGE
ncbi:ubiquinone/menaquinone biosynthesis C-methylase UbiE [Silvibacterium bohemicum]|uniref:Ubiquinone/menaquinone biosynthesis C-methylase UbiE n=1 Tax=Silvibacterium bohemicum TaxID=1577686 RepID=A0A841JZ15_9BACT|nr:class I SAM-dependent methyltransferase [Silvibacterium bohemicum]MBB6146602.1 ubiquinone/menaquinone biosynthesis C-methylase UbiE [Silvibacterium bohemicum]